nr:hypothetical protein GCM10020185_34990 [Pseudomonas brassicacearum subsp. brassicacearum]
MRFPIYLMLTKLDLVPGFMEYFDTLSKEERAQVWGMTFALDDGKSSDSPLAHLQSEFTGLEQRLNYRLVERLQQERDPARRDLIYGFPQQFGALKDCLQSFLEGVFKPNAFEERVLLRGVYFTSGTQEGSPIDRLIGSMAQSMNLDRQHLARQTGTGRSYFIEKNSSPPWPSPSAGWWASIRKSSGGASGSPAAYWPPPWCWCWWSARCGGSAIAPTRPTLPRSTRRSRRWGKPCRTSARRNATSSPCCRCSTP